MTTTPDDVTGENTAMTSSSSRGTDFYFGCAVIVVGIVGAAANGLVLYALVASKQHKKQVLIVNQNVLDLARASTIFTAYTATRSKQLARSSAFWLTVST